MVRTKGTTPKALQLKMKQEGNNGGGESSFRVLYYGDASAGSVPFMWESHPGTPKHPTTHSSLPPLTPPPAFTSNHPTSLRTLFLATTSTKAHLKAPSTSYSSISDDSSNQPTSLRNLFLASSSRRAHVAASPPSYSSLSYSLPSTPMREGQGKKEFRQRRAGVKFGMDEDGDVNKYAGGGGGSPTSMLCFGGGFMKVYRIKKMKNALMSIGGLGKSKTDNKFNP